MIQVPERASTVLLSVILPHQQWVDDNYSSNTFFSFPSNSESTLQQFCSSSLTRNHNRLCWKPCSSEDTQYLLSIWPATCQRRKSAWFGMMCSWQIFVGLYLSSHYLPCTKERFVELLVSMYSQEFQLGCFLCLCSSDCFSSFLSMGTAIACLWSPVLQVVVGKIPVFHVPSCELWQVWLAGKQLK